MKNSKGQSNKKDVAIDLWEDLSPFAHPFDKFALAYWYLPTFAVYIVAKIIGIPIWVREKQIWLGTPREDGIYLLFAVTLALVALAFNSWAARIPKALAVFSERRLVTPRQKTDAGPSYLEFLTHYKHDLHSPNRFFVIIPFLLIVVCIVILMANSRHDVARNIIPNAFASGDNITILYVFLFYLGTPLVWAYFSGVGAWITAVTGWYLWQLPVQFEIKIQPNHPDRAGGLLFFGDFCFRMVLPILLGSALMAIVGPAGIIGASPQLRLAADLALFLVALPLANITFVLPMWRIHTQMARIKRELEEYRSLRLANLDDRLQPLMREKKFADAQKVVEEINMIKASYPETVPAWPLNKTFFVGFLIQQAISIGRLILDALGDQWLTSLKNLLGIK